MDYSGRLGLYTSSRTRKTMVCLYVLLLGFNVVATAAGILSEEQLKTDLKAEASTVVAKSENKVTKREEPEAQRREHVLSSDEAVNYHGSGSGHDSGDLIPPSVVSKVSRGLSTKYGPPSVGFGGPRPSNFYGPPSKGSFRPPKFGYLPPAPPKPQYGPPSGFSSSPSLPLRPVYGPPKGQSFGPPSPPKHGFRIPKPSSKPGFSSRPRPAYGPPNFTPGSPLTVVSTGPAQQSPPKPVYGTPLLPSSSYGAPNSPAPPEIKFDGWKPISGFASSSPGGSYGPPTHTSVDGSNFIGTSSVSSSGGHSSSRPFSSHSFGSSHHSSSSFGSTAPFSSSGPGVQLHPTTSFKLQSTPSLSYGTPLAPSISYGPPSSFKGGSFSKGNFFGSLSGSFFSKGPSGPSHFKSHKPHGGHFKQSGPFFSSYKPPSSSYGPPKPVALPSKGPSSSYGPPSISPFPSTGPSFGHVKPPSITYGSPKPPSSSYGPPKPPSFYLPTTGPTGFFGPAKPPSSSYGPPSTSSTSFGHSKFPSTSHGGPTGPSVPTGFSKPSTSYGVPTGPSSTLLLPKPPSASYGPPPINTNYKVPKPGLSFSTPPSTSYRGPPVPHPLQPPAVGPPAILEGLYNKPVSPTALYGVPDAPPSTAFGCCGPSSLNVGFKEVQTSYDVPLTNVQTSVVPPTGFAPGSQAVVPYQAYGPPLHSVGNQPPSNAHAHQITDNNIPSTVLPLPQPKKPVKFRPPVPPGLISSIGAKWSSSGAWKDHSSSHHHYQSDHHSSHHGGQQYHQNPSGAYIPPAVPDPDPGVPANKGNPTIVPPPTAPPVQYGPPLASSSHHEEHHQTGSQIDASVAHVNDIDSGLNLPPPPLPPSLPTSGQLDENDYEIQQSIPYELPSLSPSSVDTQNYHSSENINYKANLDTGHYQSSETHPQTLAGNYDNGVHTIPIKGGQGSYTLEIQPAGGNSVQHGPHAEVLSNGLLQDILAAIENPSESVKLNQYSTSHVTDPVANEIGMSVFNQLGGALTQDSPTGHHLPPQYGKDLASASSDSIPEYSRSDKNDDSPTFYETVDERYESGNGSRGRISEYLNKNKIAFYYNNEQEVDKRKTADDRDLVVVKTLPNNNNNNNNNSTLFGSPETDFKSDVSVDASSNDPTPDTSTADVLKKNFTGLQLNRDTLS